MCLWQLQYSFKEVTLFVSYKLQHGVYSRETRLACNLHLYWIAPGGKSKITTTAHKSDLRPVDRYPRLWYYLVNYPFWISGDIRFPFCKNITIGHPQFDYESAQSICLIIIFSGHRTPIMTLRWDTKEDRSQVADSRFRWNLAPDESELCWPKTFYGISGSDGLLVRRLCVNSYASTCRGAHVIPMTWLSSMEKCSVRGNYFHIEFRVLCYVSCTYVNLFRLPLIRSSNKTRQWLANDHFYAPFFSNYSSSHDQISLKCTCLGVLAGLVRYWNLQVTVECTSRGALICLRPNHSKTGNGMNFSFPADTCIYKKLAWWLLGCPIDMAVVVASERRGPLLNPVSSH